MTGRRAARRCAAVLCGLMLAACGASLPPTSGPGAPGPIPPSAARGSVRAPSAVPRSGVPDFPHAFVVVMENLGYAGAMALPQVARLAHTYAYASAYYAVGHPSLPNYLALTSGRTLVTSDCWFCYVSAPNLASTMAAHGRTWGAYMEGLPSACWLGPWWPSGNYAGKHDPFRYYRDIRGSRSLCGHIQPLSRLLPLLRGPASAVPQLVWITPNLCHDGHDCPPATAAAWLSGFLPQVLRSASWRDGGAVFITWDEAGGDDAGCCGGGTASGGGGGHVLLLVLSRDLPSGLRIARPLNHYALLKTLEAAWGLPALGATASRAVPVIPGWRRGAPVDGGRAKP